VERRLITFSQKTRIFLILEWAIVAEQGAGSRELLGREAGGCDWESHGSQGANF